MQNKKKMEFFFFVFSLYYYACLYHLSGRPGRYFAPSAPVQIALRSWRLVGGYTAATIHVNLCVNSYVWFEHTSSNDHFFMEKR